MIYVAPSAFIPSRRLYAVRSHFDFTDRGAPGGPPLYLVEIEAVWFRLKSGVLSACIGRLWDYQHEIPANFQQLLERHSDGRHGGDCRTRWDGRSLWSLEDFDTATLDKALLERMLRGYPEIPEGFSGWYAFGGHK